MKINLNYFLVVALGVSLLMQRQYHKELIESTGENVKLRLYANRRDRSASGFMLPGFTPAILERVTRTASDMGMRWELPAAVVKIENGGQGLDVGIQSLSKFVAMGYKDPDDHQFAELNRMISQELSDFVMEDLELRYRFCQRYALRHNKVTASYPLELNTYLSGYAALSTPATKPMVPQGKGRRASLKKAQHKLGGRK